MRAQGAGCPFRGLSRVLFVLNQGCRAPNLCCWPFEPCLFSLAVPLMVCWWARDLCVAGRRWQRPPEVLWGQRAPLQSHLPHRGGAWVKPSVPGGSCCRGQAGVVGCRQRHPACHGEPRARGVHSLGCCCPCRGCPCLFSLGVPGTCVFPREHPLGPAWKSSPSSCREALGACIALLRQGVLVASCVIWLTWQRCNLP